MLKIVVALWLIFLLAGVSARDDGRFEQVTPETRTWVEGLTNALGVNCCSTADGFRPQQAQWDIKRNSYRVQIDGYWYDVPDYAVIKDSNRLGSALVWFSRRQRAAPPPPDDLIIICFLPGAGS